MINLFKLNKSRRKRFEKHKPIYRHVLKKCHSKIYLSGEQLKTECLFTIPQYIPGMPLFDIRECMRYIIRKLEKNKLNVQVLKPDTISISWEHISLYDRKNEQDDQGEPGESTNAKMSSSTASKKLSSSLKKKETYRKISDKPIYSIHSWEKYTQ